MPFAKIKNVSEQCGSVVMYRFE